MNLEKKWSLEIGEKDERKTIVQEKELRNISPDEFPDKVFDLYMKLEGNNTLKCLSDSTYNGDDIFIITEKINITTSRTASTGNPTKIELKIVAEGCLKDLEKIYKEALNKKFEELKNLNEDLLYAIYDWNHDFTVYEEGTKEINDETNTKSDRTCWFVLGGESKM